MGQTWERCRGRRVDMVRARASSWCSSALVVFLIFNILCRETVADSPEYESDYEELSGPELMALLGQHSEPQIYEKRSPFMQRQNFMEQKRNPFKQRQRFTEKKIYQDIAEEKRSPFMQRKNFMEHKRSPFMQRQTFMGQNGPEKRDISWPDRFWGV